MMRHRILWLLQLQVLLAGFGWAAETATAPANPFPSLLFAAEGAKKILRYGPEGKIEWEYPAQMSRDVWQLPSGNVLFCYNDNYDTRRHDNPSGVMEVTPQKDVVFHFRTTGQVWSCQRLADGNTLVGAASQGKLLIVNAKGQVVREIRLKNAPGHSCMRNARQISNGNFLVAEESAQVVNEYQPDGNLVREIRLNFPPYSAVRLEDGSTLACGKQFIVRVDSQGKVVWSFDGQGVPDLGIRWFAGIQMLPNGHIFVCNAGGKVGFMEIATDKKIIWQSNTGESLFPMGHGIQRLDAPGLPVK